MKISPSDSKRDANVSIGFGGALFLLFLGLRLTDYIDWEWYWVTAPLWIPMALGAVALAVFGIVVLIAHGLDRRDARRLRTKQRRPKPAD